jgi:predicted transcriptional regulator YdeE
VEKGAFQLAGVMALVDADRAAAEKLWEILPQELMRLGIRTGKLPEKREICPSERLEGAEKLVLDEYGGDSSVAALPQNDIDGSFQIPIENYYGVIWYPKDGERNRYFYLAGIEVPDTDISGSALVVKTVPGSKYARFIHKGPSKDLSYTMDYIYHTWLPKSGEQLAHPFELEAYQGEIGEWDQERAERGIFIPIE